MFFKKAAKTKQPKHWVEWEEPDLDMSVFKDVKPGYEIIGGMIVLIIARKGMGKTTLTAKFANDEMMPAVGIPKVKIARAEVEALHKQGHKQKTIPAHIKHLVYGCDIKIKTSLDQGYTSRESYDIDFNKISLNVSKFPFGCRFYIDEMLSKVDGQDSNKKENAMPSGQKQTLQEIRQREIAIVGNSLLANGLATRWRFMSQNVLLIVNRSDEFLNGELIKTNWFCLEFQSAAACDDYNNATDKSKFNNYKPVVLTHNGNIRKCVDSYAKNEDFVKGLENKDMELPA